MRFRLAYLLALPVMAAAPLHFEASRYQNKRCGAENTPVLATEGDKQYKVTRVVSVGQPSPLAPWHWMAGFASVLAPPIVVVLDAMTGVRGEDDDDLPELISSPHLDSSDTVMDPLGGDTATDELAEFPDPLAEDFDSRLAAIPDPIAVAPPLSPPPADTTDWMSAIVAAAQNRTTSPSPLIASAEFADPLDLDTELDDQPALS